MVLVCLQLLAGGLQLLASLQLSLFQDVHNMSAVADITSVANIPAVVSIPADIASVPCLHCLSMMFLVFLHWLVSPSGVDIPSVAGVHPVTVIPSVDGKFFYFAYLGLST